MEETAINLASTEAKSCAEWKYLDFFVALAACFLSVFITIWNLPLQFYKSLINNGKS